MLRVCFAARAAAQGPNAVANVLRDLTEILFFALAMFVPAILTTLAAIAVIKQVRKVVKTDEERAQMHTIAQQSTVSTCVISVIKEISQIPFVVIALLFFEVAALILK